MYIYILKFCRKKRTNDNRLYVEDSTHGLFSSLNKAIDFANSNSNSWDIKWKFTKFHAEGHVKMLGADTFWRIEKTKINQQYQIFSTLGEFEDGVY